MSLEKILKKIPLGLTALFLSCGAGEEKSGEKCSSDFDCKGDRICVYGQCTDSNYNGSGNNGNQSEDALSYQPRQNYDSDEYSVADTSSVTCNQNCGSSCNPNCSPLLYDDFNSQYSLWEGDSMDISGGAGKLSVYYPKICTDSVNSVYSYSLEDFKKFRLQVKVRGENGVAPGIELKGGGSGGTDMIQCIYNYSNIGYPNTGLVCDAKSGIILQYPATKNDEWHDIEMEWSNDGSVIVNFDGATAGYLKSPFPPGGSYSVILVCACMGDHIGKCFFDYVILTREN